MIDVVLDSTELRRDWLLEGFRMQLLGIRALQGSFTVHIPSPVLEEMVANHARSRGDHEDQLTRVTRELSRLGAPVLVRGERPDFDYRAYLLDRFDSILSFYVAEWPDVGHAELVARAVGRRPPFDAKGGGYRDSLVWATATEMAASGAHVALVSADNAFNDGDGGLHPLLQKEVDALAGSIELVRDLSSWLLADLPSGAGLVSEVVATERDQEFADYYFESDMQEWLAPDAVAIGFSHRPLQFEVEESVWGGDIRKVSTALPGGNAIVAEYDIDQDVEFRAVLPETAVVEPTWDVESHVGGDLLIRGRLKMVVRVRVLFDSDLSFTVDELEWKRSDGHAPGPGLAEPDTTLIELF